MKKCIIACLIIFTSLILILTSCTKVVYVPYPSITLKTNKISSTIIVSPMSSNISNVTNSHNISPTNIQSTDIKKAESTIKPTKTPYNSPTYNQIWCIANFIL